ncbi:hypothetical protein PV343_02910 [Streptomyces sp. WI03-4A]|uniref:hypothetical protein n=1 Tax=Streptomyces sp. WI03-4A TaxID=3028706 RepID=UPI0029B8C6CD|nr:hypothetical protein [Streptomyces sp. WI03-4A]MDX2591273.1 hypothetical protein [Streptomyces sp. WI03-4A]
MWQTAQCQGDEPVLVACIVAPGSTTTTSMRRPRLPTSAGSHGQGMSAQDIADRAGLSVTLVRRALRAPADEPRPPTTRPTGAVRIVLPADPMLGAKGTPASHPSCEGDATRCAQAPSAC